MFDLTQRRFKSWQHRQKRNRSKAQTTQARPMLELLEDRLAPAVFNVNSLSDILNPPTGTVTLRSAIQAANSTPGGNIINLTMAGTYQISLAGTAGETDNAAGEFAILPPGGNLTIQNTSGGTVIVDGGGLNNRVFDINPANTDNPATAILVTMNGFSIRNGIATSAANPDGADASGGGIRDQGNASLTLTNMVVAYNAATADGGGIVMENASGSTFWTLTLNKTTVNENHAGDAGGGIDADGKGTVLINTGCVVSGNTDINQGAGVYLDGIANGVDTVTITNVGSGYTSPPTVTFSPPPAGGTTATGFAAINPAGQLTGIILTNGGSGYTAGAPTVTINPPPSGTTATATASIVLSQTANLTINGTVINANSSLGAANGLGGGISNAGNGAVTIIGSTIMNNFAATTGGGFSDENNGLGTLTISTSLFVNNTAAGNGGGIFVSGPSTKITDTEIRGNASGGSGGGLFDSGATLDIERSTFSSNTASGNGGGIELQTAGATPSQITATTLARNRALNNAGGNNGGGLDAAAGFTSSLALFNDTITANYASNGGGVFWAGTTGSFISVASTAIAKNLALTAGPDANNPAGGFTDSGGNLIGVAGTGSGNTGFTAATTQTGSVASPLDPLLGPLQNNGGPTVGAGAKPGTLGTEIPLPGSPLIGKGVGGFDERGYSGGNLPDIGAAVFLTAQERFVQALYLDELGRAGSIMELDHWVAVLNGSGGTPAVVSGIVGSFEAHDRLVKGWYQKYLGRSAMNGEETGWVNLLASKSEEQVLSQLLATPEFFAHAQTLGFSGSADSQFVQALYTLILERTPSSGEITSWLNKLPTLGRQGMALGFLQSQEYRADVVGDYYFVLLHRVGDTLGINHWVTSSLDLAGIRIAFESSSEFFSDG